jgi:hypothetical protein
MGYCDYYTSESGQMPSLRLGLGFDSIHRALQKDINLTPEIAILVFDPALRTHIPYRKGAFLKSQKVGARTSLSLIR